MATGNLLLVLIAVGLLLGGGGSATAAGADACGGAVPLPLALASASRRVAKSCAAAGTPTASCCNSVVATVACVCSGAVEQPLDLVLSLAPLIDASRLVAVYSSCRARPPRLRGAGYLATTACLDVLAAAGEHPSYVTTSVTTANKPQPTLVFADANHAPKAKARGREPQVPVPPIPPSCDAALMASRLVEHCNIGNIRPSRQCCMAVLATADDQDTGCLCRAVEDAEFTKSYLTVSTIWGYYRACGGRRQRPTKDTDECEHAPAPSPPPPPPPSPPLSPPPPRLSPPAPPSKAASTLTVVLLGVGVLTGVIYLLSVVVLIAVRLKKFQIIGVRVGAPDEVPDAIRVNQVQQQENLALPPAQAPVDAEAGDVQLQAVRRPTSLPSFAPRPVVKEGQAPRAPPIIPILVSGSGSD